MPLANRLNYYRRVFSAYLLPGKSQLTFWHDQPEVNPNAVAGKLGEYHMPFIEKAGYTAHLDDDGVPLLNYHGAIGLQYNPIAIAQWGLGNCNLFLRNRDAESRKKFVAAGNWLRDHLERNSRDVWVWNHHFDWEYRTRLIAPWYSGLAQGQGISLLVRVHRETGEASYLECASRAFESFSKSVAEGGVIQVDGQGDPWIEEYIVSPPTHILNGFIWAAWGVYDYSLATQGAPARQLFDASVQTLKKNLNRYDLGFWSIYEQSGTRLPMIASPFYHRLHIVQLRVMYALTGDRAFSEIADRWEGYMRSWFNRTRALCYKGAFKLCYY
jgi:heparosan-N-sulfate-glucuronate 5-epimerase